MTNKKSMPPGAFKDPYGSIARVYDLLVEPLFRPIRRQTARRLAQYLPAGGARARVLDVAGGTGSQSRRLAKEGATVTLLDRSFAMARRAAPEAPGAQLSVVQADAVRMPLAAHSFQAVVMQMCLHEMAPATRRAAAVEILRVAGDGALFFLLDFLVPRRAAAFSAAIALVERAAGREHYVNGRHFIRCGGLKAFVRACGWDLICLDRFFQDHIGLAVVRPKPGTGGFDRGWPGFLALDYPKQGVLHER